MYVCLDTVIMYKHFITPVFSLLHLIFSSNGQLILRQRATEISPGHYPMDLACCFVLAMKNGTQRRGCLCEHFIIQVLGKMQCIILYICLSIELVLFRYLLVLERKTRGRQLHLAKRFGPKRAFFSCKKVQNKSFD